MAYGPLVYLISNSHCIPFGSLVNSSFVLMLYLEPLKVTTNVAEWLRRWTPDQTFVGSSPLIDDLFASVPDISFLNYNNHDIFSILILHK